MLKWWRDSRRSDNM